VKLTDKRLAELKAQVADNMADAEVGPLLYHIAALKEECGRLENDLEYSNSTRRNTFESIKLINQVAGVPSLSHIKDLIEIIIRFYVQRTGFSGADADLYEAFEGIKNELLEFDARAETAEAKIEKVRGECQFMADESAGARYILKIIDEKVGSDGK